MTSTRDVDDDELVVPAHGRGRLRRGGRPGNRGGLGRVPSALREALRGSFDRRVRVLEAIADGEPIERVQVSLTSVLAHARCPECGSELQATHRFTDVTVEALASARPRDRIAAIDTLARYGLGTTRDISVEVVRRKLEQTDAMLRQELPRDLYEQVTPQLRELWNA